MSGNEGIRGEKKKTMKVVEKCRMELDSDPMNRMRLLERNVEIKKKIKEYLQRIKEMHARANDASKQAHQALGSKP